MSLWKKAYNNRFAKFTKNKELTFLFLFYELNLWYNWLRKKIDVFWNMKVKQK